MSTMIKEIVIPKITALSDLAQVESQPIDCVNWKEYPGGPATSFKIAHCVPENTLCIEYTVKESNPRAVNNNDLESVWEDSCVEFFCKEDESDRYFNFEFNSKGVCLASSRRGPKVDVQYLSADKLASIKRKSEIEDGQWKLTIEIPLSIINENMHFPHPLRVNFYKCGDKCEEMHFLSWNPIDLPSPMFHCPQFFGKATIL